MKNVKTNRGRGDACILPSESCRRSSKAAYAGNIHGDVIQEGNVSLMLYLGENKKATEAEVLEQVRAGIRVMLESHTEEKRRDKKMVERVNDLDETIKSMKEEYGRKVSVDEVAERMGITEDTVEDILKLAGEEVKDE